MFNEVEDNMSKKKQPAMLPLELLAPVGREEHLTVALEEGADAIYLGASDLNARGDRAQFDEGDLPRICSHSIFCLLITSYRRHFAWPAWHITLV